MLTEARRLVSARTLISGWLLCLTLAIGSAPVAAEKSIAVLEIELLKSDLSGDATPEETARLLSIAEQMREHFREAGYAVSDSARSRSASEEVSKRQYLHSCNGCERRIGEALGAEWVLVGWVQIVSQLIINLNVVVREVDTGAIVAQAFVDLRGNTDKSWRRATQFLLEEVLQERMQKSLE